jgi:hypothetical protein
MLKNERSRLTAFRFGSQSGIRQTCDTKAGRAAVSPRSPARAQLGVMRPMRTFRISVLPYRRDQRLEESTAPAARTRMGGRC